MHSVQEEPHRSRGRGMMHRWEASGGGVKSMGWWVERTVGRVADMKMDFSSQHHELLRNVMTFDCCGLFC